MQESTATLSMELVKVTSSEINGIKTQTINARELWYFLESQRDFSTWIKERIEKYGFEEGKDFSTILGKTSEAGGRPSKDYICTLDMGKELAMVESNEKGKQARRYFIEVEKAARKVYEKIKDSYQIDDPVERAQRWIEEQEEKRKLKKEADNAVETVIACLGKIKELKPYKEYVDEISNSTTLHTANAIACQLGCSAVALNKFLESAGVLYRQGKLYLLKSEYRDKGFARMVTHKHFNSEGNVKTSDLLKWTEKGREFIHLIYYDKKKISA